VGAERCTAGQADGWIDIDRNEFLRSPRVQLPRLYRRYREQMRHEDETSGSIDP
jgi:hypothetical protein